MRNDFKPGQILGYRKNGMAIRAIAGGADDTPPSNWTNEPPAPPEQPPARTYTEEDIQRVRQEEKEKLYKRIENQNKQVKDIQTQLAQIQEAEAQRQAALEEQRKAAEEAQRKAHEDELSAKELIAVKEKEWQAQLAKIEQERQNERVMLDKEREFAQLQAFINKRVTEEQQAQTIAPELLDLVNGNSPEDVERSIVTLREKTQAILSNVQAAQNVAQSQVRGVSTAGYSTAGPMDNESAQRQITHEELQSMPMSEWAKIRGQVIPSLSGGRDRGMFG